MRLAHFQLDARAGRAHVLAAAGKIADEALRQSTLQGVPENARMLALAAQLLGD
jgi:hypothetical protein